MERPGRRIRSEQEGRAASRDAEVGAGLPVQLILLRLVLGIIAPFLLLVAGYGYWNLNLHREAVDRGLGDSAEAMSLAIDREVNVALAALSVLALSPELQSGDLAAFYRQAAKVAELFQGWVVLVDGTLQQVINTRQSYGKSLPAAGTADDSRLVFDTGRPSISGVLIGNVVQQPVVTIGVPVLRDGAVIYDLRIEFLPEHFKFLLKEQQLPLGWTSMLLDRSGQVIAGYAVDADPVPRMLGSWFSERTVHRDSGVLDGPAQDGSGLVVAFHRSPATGWMMAVIVPIVLIENQTRQAALILGAGILLSLLLAVLAALFIGRRISRPLQSIAGQAEGIIRGEAITADAYPVSEITEVRRALIRAADLCRRQFETRFVLEHEKRARAFAEQRREEAQKSERKIRRLIDANLIGVVIANQDRVLEANDAFLDLVGYNRADLEAGRIRWRSITPPGCQWLGDRAAQELRDRGEIAPFEKQYLRADGSTVPVLLGAARIDAETPELTWVCFIVDLTSQKRAEADVRRSEERYRGLVLAISSVVWTTYPDGRLDDSRQWCELTGQTPEQSAGWGWLDAIHPDDREATRQASALAIEAGSPIAVTYRLRSKNGRYRWYCSRGVPVLSADSSIREWVGVCIDIDERKSAEAQQTLLMTELDHRVRNILTTVLSLISLSARNVASLEEYAATLQGRVAAMARAHGLLSRQTWRGATVMEIVHDEFASYRLNAEVIRVEGDADLELRPKDALDFAMVVHELMTNAAKYGALSVPTGRLIASSSVAGENNGRTLRFVWQERDGPPVQARLRRGFGSRLIESVFNRGMGRSAVFAFDPRGLTCTLTMPLKPEYRPRQPADDATGNGRQRRDELAAQPRGRLLVLEREALMAMELHRLLSQTGFEVSGPAARVSEAFDLALDETLTGAVLDVDIDPDSGFSLADRFLCRGLPVVFLTGGSAEAMPERFRMLSIVQKPIDPRSFLDAVRNALQRTPVAGPTANDTEADIAGARDAKIIARLD